MSVQGEGGEGEKRGKKYSSIDEDTGAVSEDTVIWRYLDLAKLLAIYDEQCLFFPRMDRLGDPYEGTFSRVDELVATHGLGPEEAAKSKITVGHIHGFAQYVRGWTFVSCWHMSNFESDAMWKLYASQGASFAVRSTLGRLLESLGDVVDYGGMDSDGLMNMGQVYGLVKYLNYESQPIFKFNLYHPFLAKRLAFQHEKELRILHCMTPKDGEGNIQAGVEPPADVYGIKVAVEVSKLVEAVYVAPASPSWFADLLRGLQSRYELNFEVVRSDMEKPPYTAKGQWPPFRDGGEAEADR